MTVLTGRPDPRPNADYAYWGVYHSFQNSGLSSKTSELAKIYTAGALGVAEIKATRQPQQKSLPLPENDNDKLLSSVEAARIIGVTVQTLRRWVYEGRPVVGLRQKKHNELKVKKIKGHLKFEAASVHALAKKISAFT